MSKKNPELSLKVRVACYPKELYTTVFKSVFFFFLLRQGTVCGSVQATDRLMKELRDVYRSDSFKRGTLGFDVSQ